MGKLSCLPLTFIHILILVEHVVLKNVNHGNKRAQRIIYLPIHHPVEVRSRIGILCCAVEMYFCSNFHHLACRCTFPHYRVSYHRPFVWWICQKEKHQRKNRKSSQFSMYMRGCHLESSLFFPLRWQTLIGRSKSIPNPKCYHYVSHYSSIYEQKYSRFFTLQYKIKLI